MSHFGTHTEKARKRKGKRSVFFKPPRRAAKIVAILQTHQVPLPLSQVFGGKTLPVTGRYIHRVKNTRDIAMVSNTQKLAKINGSA